MKILILGGDERQRRLAEIFTDNGFDTKSITEKSELSALDESLDAAEAVVLPLPISRDGVCVYSDRSELKIPLSLVTAALDENKQLFAGIIRDNLRLELEERNIRFYDYYSDETFVTYNAFLTAQCALRLLLENTQEYIVGKRVLVTGFGRVSKAVTKLLSSVGLDVYVAARNNTQKSMAYSLGYKVLDIYDLTSVIRIFDFVVNTVPKPVFGADDISVMKDTAVYIELASKPYGADRSLFERFGKRYVPAPSLPGKFCCVSSAEAIYRSIVKEIRKKEHAEVTENE